MSGYLEITIEAPAIFEEDLTMILFSHGAEGVEVDDPALIKSHLESGDWDASVFDAQDIVTGRVKLRSLFPDDESGKKSVGDIVDEIAGYDDVSSTIEPMGDVDWLQEWKKGFNPIPIGERILVNPVWLEPEDKERIVVNVDPGMAFGTGDHATTAMVLAFLERYLKNGDTISDIGCGSGILGIAGLKLGAAKVRGIDIDANCRKSVEEHLRINRLTSEQFDLYIGDIICDEKLQRIFRREKANIVVANITADIIMDLSQIVGRFLDDHGYFIVSGIISERSREVAEMVLKQGMTIIEHRERDGWFSFVATAVGE